MPFMGTAPKTMQPFYHREVPALDVFGRLNIWFDPLAKIMKINYVMEGDGFPDAEAFLIDQNSKSIFLATHIRYGSATGQLKGTNHHPMCKTNIDVEMKPDFTFGDKVTCHQCWDYVDYGPGIVHLENSFKSGTVDQWNDLHRKRDPSVRNTMDNFIGKKYDPNQPQPDVDVNQPYP